MKTKKEIIGEAEIVVEKKDSEGNIYYENVINESNPNWEMVSSFVKKIPIKELIVGTLVFSILFLIPNQCEAKNKAQKETLIRFQNLVEASKMRKLEEKILLEESKKLISIKKIESLNQTLVHYQPITQLIRYLIGIVNGQIESFKQDKMTKLILLEQAKQLEEQKRFNQKVVTLMTINGGFLGFNAISQAIELGKNILLYFEKNPNRKYKKKRIFDEDFLWEEKKTNNQQGIKNVPGWLISLIAVIAWQKGGEVLDKVKERLSRSKDPIIASVGNLLNTKKKSNGIVEFVKTRPILFTIGTVGIIAGTVLIIQQIRKLDTVKSVENTALSVLRDTINNSYSAFGAFMHTQSSQFQQLWEKKVLSEAQAQKSSEIEVSSLKKEKGAISDRLDKLRASHSTLETSHAISNTKLESCQNENEVLREGINTCVQKNDNSDNQTPLVTGGKNILDVPTSRSNQ